MVTALHQDLFSAELPSLEKLARNHFRHLPPDAQAEAVQNSIGLAWKQYRALVLQGRADQVGILKSVMWYAIRQTKCGRTPQGCPKKKGLNEIRRRGVVRFEEFEVSDFMGRCTPIVDQVSFRIDVPRFFDTLTNRQREMAFDLATGMTTSEVAEKYGVTAGAISQFRSRFKDLFEEFFAA